MENFNYHQPKTVAEAVAALKSTGGEGKFLAGGQSLLPVMKLDMAAPSDLISLAGIEEMKGICEDGDWVVVGASVSHAEVHDSDIVRERIPALADMAGLIGDAQVRNRGTLGGSIAHADPAADYPGAILGLGTRIKTDRREIAGDDFFKGLFETALEEDEIITSVYFKVPKRANYQKFASPASKYPLVGVFVAELDDGPRLAITGAATHGFRVPQMEKALAGNFAPSALDGITVPASELRSELEASAEYRCHLIGVLAKRAVAAASA